MRRAILERRLKPGTRLPSSRQMAEDLDCARGTVVLAFDQLVAEGYVVSQAGSAMSVAANLPDEMLTVPRTGAPLQGQAVARPAVARRTRALLAETPSPVPAGPPSGLSHRPAGPRGLPFALWAKLLEREWRRPGIEAASAVHPFGHAGLREAIATYLGVARGFTCDPGPSSSRRASATASRCSLKSCSMPAIPPGSRSRASSASARRWRRPVCVPCLWPSTKRVSQSKRHRRWRPRRASPLWRPLIIFRSAPCSACSGGSNS